MKKCINPSVVVTSYATPTEGYIRIYPISGNWTMKPSHSIEWYQSNEPANKGNWIVQIFEGDKCASSKEYGDFYSVITRIRKWSAHHGHLDINEL